MAKNQHPKKHNCSDNGKDSKQQGRSRNTNKQNKPENAEKGVYVADKGDGRCGSAGLQGAHKNWGRVKAAYANNVILTLDLDGHTCIATHRENI